MSNGLLKRPGDWVAALLSYALTLIALPLSPWRLGRLVRTVSIPRLREHPLRTNLTVLGVALGVAVLLAVGIVSHSILRGITATVDDLAGKADLQIVGGSSGFDEAVLDRVRAVPGVYHLTPALQQIVTISSSRGRGERMLLMGVDMLDGEDAYFRSYGSRELDSIRHDSLDFLNSSTNIIISRAFATRYGYKLHDKIPIATANGVKPFDIWGFIDVDGVGKAFGGSMGIMYYPAMQMAFGRGSNVDRIDIAVTPGTNVDVVSKQLKATLGDAFVIERPLLRGDRIGKMLLSVQLALIMSGAIALIAGIFLIYNTMSTSVAQRKREFGILRALGTTRAEVLQLLTLEGMLLGIMSAAVGVLLGIALSKSMLTLTSRSLNGVYLQIAVSEVHVAPWLLVVGFVLGVLGATLASTIPAYRAGKVKPAETLRTSGLMTVGAPARGLTRSDVLAIVLLVLWTQLLRIPTVKELPLGGLAAAITVLLAGALLLPRLVQLIHRVLHGRWIGLETALARDNLPRDMRRTSATAAALMAGVSLTMGFAAFIESFTTSLDSWSAQVAPGDLFVTSGASVSGLSAKNVPMTDDMYGKLEAIDGVERIRRIRSVEIDYRGLPIKVVSSDLDVFTRRSHLSVLEGTEAQIIRDLTHGQVTVSENFARRFNVHRGDQVTLAAANGPRKFQVAGVLVDYTSDIGSIMFDRRSYVSAWADDRVDTYELSLRRSADPQKVRSAIYARYSAQYDLFVLTNREFRGEFVKATDQIFSVLRVLEVVTLIVAALGIINALFASVLDRVREIGVLRAVGMLRTQVRRMIVIEASLVSGIGTLAGMLVGMLLGYIVLTNLMMSQIGWYFPYRIPWRSVLELCLVTVPVSALASWYPARKAANLVVTESLEYE